MFFILAKQICVDGEDPLANFPGWLPPLAILLLLFLGNGGYGTLIWVNIVLIKTMIINIMKTCITVLIKTRSMKTRH